MGAFIRHDYYTRFTPDTVRLMHQDKNDLSVDTDQRYDLWLKIHHLKADGIRLHTPLFMYDELKVRLSISLFHATGVIDGEISGQIDTTADSFSGLIDLNYLYDQDRLLGRQVESPVGWGYGIGLEIQWHMTQSVDVHLQLKDIAAQIRWDKAPYTTAQLTSSTVNFDSNGFIETTPALSGFEGYKSYTQALPLQSKLQFFYQLSEQYGLFAVDEMYATEHFSSIGLECWDGAQTYSLGWGIRNQALQLGWRNESFRLNISFDDFNQKKLKMFGLEFSLMLGR